MNPSNALCDDNQLRLLLANQLPPELEHVVAGHLTGCSACKQKLETLAGDGDWWSTVKTCFAQNADQLSADRSSSSPTASIGVWLGCSVWPVLP